jgi:hypothetical protein
VLSTVSFAASSQVLARFNADGVTGAQSNIALRFDFDFSFALEGDIQHRLFIAIGDDNFLPSRCEK